MTVGFSVATHACIFDVEAKLSSRMVVPRYHGVIYYRYFNLEPSLAVFRSMRAGWVFSSTSKRMCCILGLNCRYNLFQSDGVFRGADHRRIGGHILLNDNFRLRRVLSRLDQCQIDLSGSGDAMTAKLLQMAALEIRLRMNRMGDAELKELTENFALQARPSATIHSIDEARIGEAGLG